MASSATAEPPPDALRCKRTDGRHWRCKRHVMEGKLLCEIHSAQVRLRNVRIQVPESLKLQRSKTNASTATKTKNNNNNNNNNPNPPEEETAAAELRASGREHLDRKNKRKRSDSAAEADLADKNAQVKADELLSAFADRRKKKKKAKVEEKTKTNSKKKKNVERSGEEVTRELPFGRMAISPMPDSDSEKEKGKPAGNAGGEEVKVGVDPPSYRMVDRRFRSKNVEQPPIVIVKAVPYAGNGGRGKGKVVAGGGRVVKKKCHWCQKSRSVSLNKCLTCKKRFFCSNCIKERSIEEKEVKIKCPVCTGTCECNACSTSHPKDVSSEDNLKKQCKISKYLSLHYMISLILPILEQINEEQRIELEMEAKLKEQSLSEVEILQADGDKKQMSCNKCSSKILDMHRSCSSCSYKLCLSCCQETRDLMLQGSQCPSKKKSSSRGKARTEETLVEKSMQNADSLDSDSLALLSSASAYTGNLFCPSLELGSCSSSILDLRCIFPLNYTRDLEISAKEIILGHELPKILDHSLHCSLCSAMAREGGNRKGLLEASRRKHPGDNFLYSPNIHDDYDVLLVHFQKHWRNCHPVIVRDLLEKASNLNWNPLGIFSNYLKMDLSSCENGKEKAGVPNSTDWYKVDFLNKESYNGSLMRGVVQSSHETLRLKAKLSSVSCQGFFSAHYAEIVNALPIQEYTNPSSGLLNIAAKSADDSQVSEFSPQIHITCGSVEEVQSAELGDALCLSSHDQVNILVRASDFSPSTDQVNKIKTLVRMKNKGMGGCNGLVQENGMAGEHSKISDEAAGQTEKSVNGTVATSSVSAAMEDPPVGIVKNSTAKAPASETESDSSVMCSGTSDNRDKTMGEMYPVDRTEPSTSERESSEERPCGIRWDVFRKQDTPKLLEYIQKHSDEFYNTCGSSKQVTDPVLDGSFFLDSAHQMKLKQEFKIEPWTFNQRLGEAVFIPAGCPYQTMYLKSCVNVVLGFISPEHARECIKLADKLQDLPTDHKPKASRVEVEKMVINKISKVIDEMRSEAQKQSP